MAYRAQAIAGGSNLPGRSGSPNSACITTRPGSIRRRWAGSCRPIRLGMTDQINLYAYVNNDPANLNDALGLAPGDPYRSPRDATVDWQNSTNPRSIRENKEYNGATYELRGRYYSTPGARTGVTGGTTRIPLPPGARVVEEMHTHGDYTRVDHHENRVRSDRHGDRFASDEVNSEDQTRANNNHRVVTVGTPSGMYQRYDPATRTIEAITPYVPAIALPDQPGPQEPPRPDPPPE